ncbi:iron-containing alcohol dehydrogenase [Acaryochloris sp. IP29b_bin.148]|uniref:iron-containing alcohol dehydrogenase n=1 Tax=Acaryochloris sp. IP29b_bin.148 TaxID=2969218 RepID=UPI002636A08C|nr:iron-containing alcohol dehydrogenase [Acaryochloris sp. IP29b_bin.148]
MQDFKFNNPVKILFGKGQIASISEQISPNAKVLMVYGGGSIKQNGVYEQVIAALGDRSVIEFGGVEPNPKLETLTAAIEIARSNSIDFLLAVGGGSVIDATKFIAAATHFQGDPWDILAKREPVASALPLGTVLTLPATGSEMNRFFVITNDTTQEKVGYGSEQVFPQFSVLDPETTFSLPLRQISNGIVDAFTHTVEQYLTYPVHAPLQDRMAESILTTLIEEGPKTLADPADYESRANVMWCASMALNGLIGAGVPQDWATHMIGHELTALYQLDHAQTLAVVLPSLLQVKQDKKKTKLLQYAERVWNITAGDESQRISQAIASTAQFFASVGVATRLSDYRVDQSAIKRVAQKLDKQGATGLGEHQDISPTDVERILTLSA